jgi:dienelactone hydrolase
MSRRGAWLAGAAVGGLALLSALGWRFGPALLLSAALAAPSAEGWLRPLGHEVTRREVTVEVGARRIGADLYRPARARAALLLVHGLSESGRRHPELVRLAGLLAQRGLLVMVPHFDGLAAFRLSGAEVEEVRAALAALAAMGLPTGVAGFSFGAGPALLAAADMPGLALAASFGGYARLHHVIAYVTTGVHAFGGRRYVARQEDYNRWKLLALLAGFADTRDDRELLDAIARFKLANPAEDTRGLEAGLGPGGAAVLALVVNRREDAVAPLLAALPPRAQEALERLSPLGALPRLRSRLLVAHGAEDPSIPFTESLRLGAAAGGAARVVILETFHHTGPRAAWESLGLRALDAWRLLGLADALLTG